MCPDSITELCFFFLYPTVQVPLISAGHFLTCLAYVCLNQLQSCLYGVARLSIWTMYTQNIQPLFVQAFPRYIGLFWEFFFATLLSSYRGRQMLLRLLRILASVLRHSLLGKQLAYIQRLRPALRTHSDFRSAAMRSAFHHRIQSTAMVAHQLHLSHERVAVVMMMMKMVMSVTMDV